MRQHLFLPLLGKELVEQAARPRMYLARVLYAVLLYAAFGWLHLAQFQVGEVGEMLGAGRWMLDDLYRLQLAGILLFLPPVMAAAITAEKERGTLELLFVTDLSAWSLVLQKYLGRLLPMFTFLLLGVPLLGVAYTFGGVEADQVRVTVISLLIASLEVGALALMFSAYSATTTEALLRCYTIGAILFLLTFVPQYPLGIRAGWTGSLIATVVYLVLARSYLYRRADAHGRDFVSKQFHRVTLFWQDTRRIFRRFRRAGGEEIMTGTVLTRTLPRERRYLLGLWLNRLPVPGVLSVVAIAGWVLFIVLGVAALASDGREQEPVFTFFAWLLWVVLALLVTGTSANAIASERANQTLEVLLTTPLTGREILADKQAGIRQLGWVLGAMLGLVFLLEAWAEHHAEGWLGLTRALEYLAASAASVVIFPTLLRWLALWIGLRVRRQSRAVLLALGLVAAWVVVPYRVADSIELLWWLAWLSPAAMIEAAETGRVGTWDVVLWPTALAGYAVYGTLAWWVRRQCLRNADRYLGRNG